MSIHMSIHMSMYISMHVSTRTPMHRSTHMCVRIALCITARVITHSFMHIYAYAREYAYTRAFTPAARCRTVSTPYPTVQAQPRQGSLSSRLAVGNYAARSHFRPWSASARRLQKCCYLSSTSERHFCTPVQRGCHRGPFTVAMLPSCKEHSASGRVCKIQHVRKRA